MTVEFNIKGETFEGEVLFRGFYQVDKPESYEVEVGTNSFYVPVCETKIISE